MKKILIVISVVALVLFLILIYFYRQFQPASKINFGLTFSTRYAAYLGFDPKQAYLDMLADLKPKKLRLMAYWEDLESEKGKFDYQLVDELLIEAQKQNIEVVLVVGHKQPRWPECHRPDWYNNLDAIHQEEALFEMLNQAVGHFKQFSAIKIWQLENEPYFGFGVSCPLISENLIQREVAVVKAIDSRPVLLTDSGERGNWSETAKFADILGVTMYRTVFSPWFGYYKYPLPPWFYKIKAGIFNKTVNKPIIGAELQAEPWLTKGIFGTDLDTQKALMNPKIFQANIEYAKKVGLGDNYLWGVEWWYWMAKKQNDWGMWGVAKNLLVD